MGMIVFVRSMFQVKEERGRLGKNDRNGQETKE
jgi:hypothetical protein